MGNSEKILCGFQFLVPFNLAVEDHFFFKTKHRGNTFFCNFLSITGKETTSYDIVIDNESKINLYARKTDKFTDGTKVDTLDIEIPEKEYFAGKRTEYICHTLASIYFYSQSKKYFESKYHWILEEAKSVLAKFIDSYRESINCFYFNKNLIQQSRIIFRLTSEDDFHFIPHNENHNLLTATNNILLFPEINTINHAGYNNKRYIKSKITENKALKIAERLNHESGNEFQSLIHDIKERCHVDKDFSTAIIYLSSILELFVQRHFIYIHKNKNIKKIQFRGKKILLQKFAEENNINTLLRKLDRTKGTDICNSNEFKSWREKAYKIRNKIIHRGKKDISEETTKEAYDTTVNLIQLIQDEK